MRRFQLRDYEINSTYRTMHGMQAEAWSRYLAVIGRKRLNAAAVFKRILTGSMPPCDVIVTVAVSRLPSGVVAGIVTVN